MIDNLVLSDNIDILESNSLKIEGIDLNNIPLGISNINVYCIDSSTNKSNILNLNVIVINSLKKIDYTLKTNEKLSKDQVINHLIENEIIPNTYDTIILESSYFNKDSNFGMHTAYVILKSKTEETSYSFIIEYIEKENEFDQDLVLTIIISIFVLELIIYVKRH